MSGEPLWSAVLTAICSYLRLWASTCPNDRHADCVHSGQYLARLFRTWGFPPRRFIPTAEEEAIIIQRIRELWAQNHNGQVIVEVLQDEGWELSERSVTNLRRKHGLHMRGLQQYQTTIENYVADEPVAPEAPATYKPAQDAQNISAYDGSYMPGPMQQLQNYAAEDNSQPTYTETPAPPTTISRERRATKRMLELLEESDRLLETRKRRRRIRGRGLLPADAPGLPPRNKSETTIDECKVFLELDNEMYQALRAQYVEICDEAGIVKKTLCQPGVWDASKDRLIRENAHLHMIMNTPNAQADKVANALEVVCAAVTKHIRDQNKRISIQDANNALGLDPHQSKHVRALYYQILDADGFTTRMECGMDRWERNFQMWLSRSPELSRIRDRGIDAQTQKYLNVLTRDAMKRLNEGRTKTDPNVRQAKDDRNYGPGPGPANRNRNQSRAKNTATRASAGGKRRSGPGAVLDPNLLNANAPPPLPPVNTPAFFRLAPNSRLVGNHPKMWLGKLEHATVESLHKAATSKVGAAKVGKIQGVVKTGEGPEGGGLPGGPEEGFEINYVIENRDELSAYLDAAGEKVVFIVELSGGYA